MVCSLTNSLLLYVHIPFCASKCHFCFKVNHIPRRLLLDANLHEDYIVALIKSIKHYVPCLANKYQPIGINWGGGTPTILKPSLLENIAQAFLPYWDLSTMYFSVEATPETLTQEQLHTLKNIGVNRISIGVQSFNNAILCQMGRHHSSKEAIEAVERARACGFSNLNLDLIVSLPGETVDDSMSSIETAIKLAPSHVTTYFYHPAPNTVLLRRLMQDPNLFWDLDDHMRRLKGLQTLMEGAGYQNYEFFHWSRDPSQWSFVSLDHYFGHAGDVFGFGSGAQSFVSPYGNLEMLDVADYLADPLAMRPGKLDLEYALERALGCRFGLNYAALARTFGITEEEVRRHPLVTNLQHVPGVVCRKEGLAMRALDFMREHTIGMQSRMHQFLALPDKDQRLITMVS